MEDRLNDIISRIEASSLSDGEKAQLYASISGGLQASVWPVLMKYIPSTDIDTVLAEPDGQKKVELYKTLISQAVDQESTLPEIEETMTKLLDEVDAALKEEQI